MIPGHRETPIWDAVVGMWNRIDEEEEVFDTGKTLEWLMITGAEQLVRMRDGRTALADAIVRRYGYGSEVAVFAQRDQEPRLYVGGELHDGSMMTATLEEGARPDLCRVILRPNTDTWPNLVLGNFPRDDIPGTLSVTAEAVAGLTLVDGPSGGFPRARFGGFSN